MKQISIDTDVYVAHEKLRADVLDYMVGYDGDPIELLKSFAERLRAVIGCDQVVYRDLEDTCIMANSASIENTWSVPLEYCVQCAHFDAHHPMYADGFTEMSDCRKGFNGIPTYHLCPIKSSLTRIVTCDGEVAGYLAIHFIEDYHEFTELERMTVANFARIMSIALSRYETKKKNRDMHIIKALAYEYSSVYLVSLADRKLVPYDMRENTETEFGRIFRSGIDYEDAIRMYADRMVYSSDRAMFLEAGSLENLQKRLAHQKSFKITFRDNMHGEQYFCELTFVKTDEEDDPLSSFAVALADKDAEIIRHFVQEELQTEYISIFYVNLETDHYRTIREPNTTKTMDREDHIWSKAMKNFAHECEPAHEALVRSIGNPSFLKRELADVNRREYVYRFPSASQPWRRAIIKVVERRGVIPQVVIASFMDIDDVRSRALDMEAKIVEQKRLLEMQRSQLQDALTMAQAANRAKTTFLNNMSHDIRTPMNAIIGYTELAMNHLDERENLKDFLEKIGRSSNHLLNLINDVLDMSRIESGKISLNEQPENISEIINTLCDILQTDISTKRLTFHVNSISVTDKTVICDKLRVNQALLNVLSNAVKYTENGGAISMKVVQKPASRQGYALYEFTVHDNGIGMDETFLQTIFEPFTRESSTVSGIQGTGLGMSIAKNIMNMMNGTIDVQSKVGEGTTVTLIFEFKLQTEESAVPAEPLVPARIDFTGKKVLLVEDNPLNIEIAVDMLTDNGFIVDTAEDGTVAVEKMRDAEPGDYDVVLMDIQMPKMDGYEATRRIRAMETEVSKIPIVAMTANAFAEDRSSALEAGMNDHIPKPIKIATLREALAKILF